MAIAFDNAGGAVSVAANPTFSATVNSNTNGILIVRLNQNSDTTDVVTDITFNGTSFFANKVQAHSFAAFGNFNYVFYMLTPPVTTANIAVTGVFKRYVLSWASYTGVSQSSPLNTSNTQNSGGTSITGGTGIPDTSITPSADNCWGISTLVVSDGTFSAGTGTTSRVIVNSGEGAIGDSNGTIANGAAYHLKWNTTGAGTFWDSIDLVLAPAGGTTTIITPTLPTLMVG